MLQESNVIELGPLSLLPLVKDALADKQFLR